MSRHETKFYFKTIIISLFVLILFGYGFYELWKYLSGPQIILNYPTDGLVVSESLIEIEGQVKNSKLLTLNDRPIVVDQLGNFHESLLLSYGYNILKLHAEDRFGKQTGQTLQIIYK